MLNTFIIHNQWALGDTVCLSALVRDIHKTYPGKYKTILSGHYQSYWRDCPYAQAVKGDPKGQLIKPDYAQGIREAGRGSKNHFLSYFHKDFELKTGIKVPVTEPKGEFFLTREEKQNSPYPERYWVIVAGCKADMTTKQWDLAYWQQTVDTLSKLGLHCVQAGADFNRHYHTRLNNVTQAIGTTDDIRDFFKLIYHCDGVICGITAAMHIAAVFDKPCVIIAGGREEVAWESYQSSSLFGEKCSPVKVEHTFLHTIGLLDCCEKKGCWKDRVVPLDKDDLINSRKKSQLCKRPLRLKPQAIPECMRMITPDMVVAAVMNYFEKGFLPPVQKPKENTQELVYPAVVMPKEFVPPVREEPSLAVLDHPFIGGKFTVCVLGYGDNHELMKRCLNSILNNTPLNRLDLRVALNQPGNKLLDYINGFDEEVISKVYLDQTDRKKYPAMRAMFWDNKKPITTPYLLWFDDDSHVLDKKWLVQLGECIIKNHPQGCRLYGTKYIHDLMAYKRQGFSPEKWFQEADWWQNKWLHTSNGERLIPNGHQIVFATGGFWALSLEAIRRGNIPDKRLVHNGGDCCIGAQVHQAGFKVCDFSRGKKPVCWSDAPRRGYSEVFPWSRYT